MTRKEVDIEIFDDNLNIDDDTDDFSPWVDDLGICMGDIGDRHASGKQKSAAAHGSLRARS